MQALIGTFLRPVWRLSALWRLTLITFLAAAGVRSADAAPLAPPPAPVLALNLSHDGFFYTGANSAQTDAQFTLTVANVGGAPTSGAVTVQVRALDPFLYWTATSITGKGWTCALTQPDPFFPGSFPDIPYPACSRDDALKAGKIYPAITLTVSVTPGMQMFGPVVSNTSVTFLATGGATRYFDDTDAVVIELRITQDLLVVMAHDAYFTAGKKGKWTITVTNGGGLPTSGQVTVYIPQEADDLMVPTKLAGSGWQCVLATKSCTRSDALAPGESYPAITWTVTVAPQLEGTWYESVEVSGGGDYPTDNNTFTDLTIIRQK